jgi:hypothetical protein
MADSVTIPCSCCEIECCEEVAFYSYGDSEPPGKTYSECPNVSGDCSGAGASCCGESVEGFIKSGNFRNGCKDNLAKSPKAIIYAGAMIDNIGGIGGAGFEQTGECPSLFSVLNSDEIVESVGVVDNGDGTFHLRLPFSASNDASCGPVGIMGATVKWFFGEECGSSSSGQGLGLSLL